jgi:hypothetical protein
MLDTKLGAGSGMYVLFMEMFCDRTDGKIARILRSFGTFLLTIE